MNMEMAVKLAKEGKEEGFNYLYQETYQKSYYVALKYMKQEDAAMDVLQDAYIKAFKSLDQLEDASKFHAWFSRVVATKALDELRKRKLVLFSQVEDEDGLSFEETFEDNRTDTQPELSMDQAETSRLVKEMIDTLTDEQRMCIMMFYMEEMSVKEIAETLQVSENTVKSRLNYGRKNIKEKVLELEKKGTKLYSVTPFMFFLYLLRAEAQNTAATVVPDTFATKVVAEGMKSVSSSNAGIGATVVAGVGKTVGGVAVKKIIVGLAVMVALGGGGVVLVSALSNQSNNEKPENEIVYENEADDPNMNVDEEDIVERGTSGDVNWVYTEDKELIIYGQGAMCDYMNLEEDDVNNEDLPDNKSSFHKMQIEKIIIKEGVTHVGANAFDCFGVYYQDEVEIMMADSVTSLGEAAFANMRYVKSIELSSNIKVIPKDCFAYNAAYEIVIHDGIERIEEYAFSNTSNLKEITIPDSVNYIGKWAFFGCSNLENITLPEGLTVIEEALFYHCYNLKECNIPSTVVEIKDSVFADCRSLTEIVIPENVQTIDGGLFYGCENLETIYIYSMSQEIPDPLSISSNSTGGVDMFGANSPTIYCKEGSGVHNSILEMEEYGYFADYVLIK